MDNKFALIWGIHSMSLTSRDTGETKYFDTDQEAVDEYQRLKDWFALLGYKIWYARVKSPEGEERNLESNPYYG